MPLTSADAPKTLPPAGKRLWAAAFNNAYEGTCEGDDTCCGKVAWTVVKKKFRQRPGGLWSARSIMQSPGGMYITKVSRDTGSGERRWSSTASDNGWDWFNQRMTLELFDNFIKRAESGKMPPALTSKAWMGGLPYLGVAHYLDMDGLGIVGPTNKLYRDGQAFKAKGLFLNEAYPEVAEAAYQNALADTKLPTEERARISIAFIDMEHRHTSNNMHFVRKTLSDTCPACEEDPELIEFLDGYLIHLALTRIPANWRVDFNPELELRSMTEEEEEDTAQHDDAASILGKELADRYVQAAKKASVVKSEAGPMIIKSEATEPPPVDPGVQQQAPIPETPDATLVARVLMLEGVISQLVKTQGVTMDPIAINPVVPASIATHPLDEVWATLRTAYDRVMTDPAMDRTAKMAALNGPVNELSSAILRGVASSTPVSTSDLETTVRKVINELLTPILSGLQVQQMQAPAVVPVPSVSLSTVPIIRSAQPTGVSGNVVTAGQVLTIRDLARLTSGLPVEQKGA